MFKSISLKYANRKEEMFLFVLLSLFLILPFFFSLLFFLFAFEKAEEIKSLAPAMTGLTWKSPTLHLELPRGRHSHSSPEEILIQHLWVLCSLPHKCVSKETFIHTHAVQNLR